MLTNIKYEDISVILQGPVTQNTLRCINSINNFLPGAEIILSTWEGTCTEFLKCDKIIYCQDPGCAYWNPPKTIALNLNRWIVSSREGVAASTRKYVLKMRTDLEIVSSKFLDYYDQFNQREEEFVLAKHKILIPSIYTLKYLGHNESQKNEIPTPLHLSDWYCFGLKEDIWNFVNIPLVDDLEDFARYFERRPYLVNEEYSWWISYWLRKYAPEQYIGYCYAKRLFPNWNFTNALCFDEISMIESEKFIVNNFVILDPIEFGIIFPNSNKMGISANIDMLNIDFRYGLYSQHVYVEDYIKYCDSGYQPISTTPDIRYKQKQDVPLKRKLKLFLVSVMRRLSPSYNIACYNRQRIDQIEKNIVQKIMVNHRELNDSFQDYGK